MHDAGLTAALARLDERLLAACDAEERRATLLTGDGRPGWDGVRNLARPSTQDLTGGSMTGVARLVEPGLPGFDALGAELGLDDVACDALLVLLAVHVEPRYQALYAVLQDNVAEHRPTERLVHSVLGVDAGRRHAVAAAIAPGGPLLRGGLIRRVAGSFPPLGRPLELAEEVAAALLGDPNPAVPGALAQQWSAGSAAADGMPPLQVLHGSGDPVAMARLQVPAGYAVLEVVPPQPPGTPGAAVDPTAVALAAWRVGLVTGAQPVLDLRAWPTEVVGSVVAALDAVVRELGGRAWACGWHPVPLDVPHVEATPLTWDERRRAWTEQAAAADVALDDDAAGRLASRHRLDAAAIGRALGAASGTDEPALDAAAERLHAAEVPRSTRTTPRRTFDDLVLTPTTLDALQRLVHYAERKDRLAQEQGLAQRFPVDRGPLVLFAGRSGTGKTAAAEAVATALRRPLYTVDISRLLSKYIGETEKHVDEVLQQVQRSSGVLLCDEADALFASRVEHADNAAEHFTNVLVGYLLQRIELHDGVVILSTNLRHAIDDAFLRRFHFRVEFPMPSPDERRRIWELMLLPAIPREPGLDLDRLAKQHALSGGDITNAAMRAVFLADRDGRPLGQSHLDRAVALELLEQGRLSRRQALDERFGAGRGPAVDRGELLRALADRLEADLAAQLRWRFLKEIHVVHGSPTDQVLAGRRPAVSLALFRVAAKRGTNGLRAGFIASAWSALPEEEYELLGVVHEVLAGADLDEVAGRAAALRVQESYDFDLLQKFWSSHDRPMRPSVVFDVEIE